MTSPNFSNSVRRLTSLGAIFSCILIMNLLSQQQCEARRSKSQRNVQRKCQDDECQLSESHFALYSNVKRALDRNFDLVGKEIPALLSSVELLKRRFSQSETIDQKTTAKKLPPAGYELVDQLLSNETLKHALEVFQSDEGRALVDSYRASINGKGQNLACSPFRIQDIERLSRKLESSQQLKGVFARVHENFVKRSARKCLKRSCTSIEDSMSRLDSILVKKKRRGDGDSDDSVRPDTNRDIGDSESSSNSTGGELRRANEFELEELELCKFFKKSNESDCKISGRELSDISLLLDQRAEQQQQQAQTTSSTMSNESATTSASSANQEATRQKPSRAPANEYFDAYYKNSRESSNSTSAPANEETRLEEAGRLVMAQCKPIKRLLEYNLYALGWYRRHNVISEKKLSLRSFWCPTMFYWLQIDRLCGEVEVFVETFSNSISDLVVNNKNLSDSDNNNNNNNNKVADRETYQY